MVPTPPLTSPSCSIPTPDKDIDSPFSVLSYSSYSRYRFSIFRSILLLQLQIQVLHSPSTSFNSHQAFSCFYFYKRYRFLHSLHPQLIFSLTNSNFTFPLLPKYRYQIISLPNTILLFLLRYRFTSLSHHLTLFSYLERISNPV